MDTKPDGKQYSRITRRSVAIIGNIKSGRLYSMSELAEEIHGKKLPEFYLKRFNRQMSISRTRDYIRFLRDIGVVVEQEDKVVLDFRHRRLDSEWAQSLSDLAFLHLAKLLNKQPQDVPNLIEKGLATFYKNKQLPTLNGLSLYFGIPSGHNEETFKWSVLMYTDGDSCPFLIRHFPVLAKHPRS